MGPEVSRTPAGMTRRYHRAHRPRRKPRALTDCLRKEPASPRGHSNIPKLAVFKEQTGRARRSLRLSCSPEAAEFNRSYLSRQRRRSSRLPKTIRLPQLLQNPPSPHKVPSSPPTPLHPLPVNRFGTSSIRRGRFRPTRPLTGSPLPGALVAPGGWGCITLPGSRSVLLLFCGLM